MAACDQFAQCVLDLGAQQAGAVGDVVEERRAVVGKILRNALRA